MQHETYTAPEIEDYCEARDSLGRCRDKLDRIGRLLSPELPELPEPPRNPKVDKWLRGGPFPDMKEPLVLLTIILFPLIAASV